jgi:hypothetical protein
MWEKIVSVGRINVGEFKGGTKGYKSVTSWTEGADEEDEKDKDVEDGTAMKAEPMPPSVMALMAPLIKLDSQLLTKMSEQIPDAQGFGGITRGCWNGQEW